MRLPAIPRAGIAAILALLAASPGSPSTAAGSPHPPLPLTLLATGAPTKPATSYNGEPDTGQFLPDSAVLIRVDAKTFRVSDYVNEYFAAFSGSRPARDSLGRVKFLNSLIDREVLAAAARKVGYNIGYEGRVDMRNYTQRILANELFRRLVIDSAQVSEQEIQRTYQQYKAALRLKRILFANRATGERVRLDLIAGRITWGAAVTKYSRATGDHADGDMGWVRRGGLSVPIADQVYAIQPGQISQVIEDETGPQILKLVETRPAAPPALDTIRRQIRNQLMGYRVSLGASRVQAAVVTYMGLNPDTANIAWACRFFPKPVDVERRETGGTTLNVNEIVPEFSNADTSRILARWKGGSLSLGRFLIEYSNLSAFSRPNVNTAEGMTQMVENIASEPYKAQMAVDRGFDKDPVVVYQIDSHYDRLIVTRMYSDSVEARVQVTPAERRAEYDAHPERYRVSETRRFATILRYSQTSADSLAAALRHGASAAAVIAADSSGGFQSGMIRTQTADEHGMFKKIVFEELKPGQVTTMPGNKQGGVAVVQLLGVTPERLPPFAEVQVAADDNLRADKSDQLMKVWLERLRKGHTIESHPDLVMRVRMVDPLLTI